MYYDGIVERSAGARGGELAGRDAGYAYGRVCIGALAPSSCCASSRLIASLILQPEMSLCRAADIQRSAKRPR